MTTPPTWKIAVCLFDEVTSLDYMGPVELFVYFTKAMGDAGIRQIDVPILFDFTYLNYTRDPVKPMSGPRAFPDKTYDEVGPEEQFDVVLLPGGPGSRPDLVQPSLIKFLQRQEPGAKYFLSVCTGSWVYAQAGLLEGKRATTNKSLFKIIQAATAQNKVEWVAKARWVVDGKFWTASGVTAGIDMANAFIEHTMGKDFAKIVRDAAEYKAHDQGEDDFAEIYGLA
ncbi:class I glutamine amidotransferase-like protein [Panus rudis PR-1116 ss-1]|nr:class I glutamine amidotransferase-like protein [Panus rudis PR-1116 ss-1]